MFHYNLFINLSDNLFCLGFFFSKLNDARWTEVWNFLSNASSVSAEKWPMKDLFLKYLWKITSLFFPFTIHEKKLFELSSSSHELLKDINRSRTVDFETFNYRVCSMIASFRPNQLI